MFAEVEKYCLKKQLFSTGGNIVIACSGGPDSLLLLEFFCAIKDKWNLNIKVAHFEHGIRGNDSVADADFVKRYCALKQIPFSMGQADVPLYARNNKMSVETAARKLRYDFLQKISQEMGRALIATAHHADDQAETVLMRILHGTGINGLQSIKPKNGIIIRPFLFLTKTEILKQCNIIKLKPCHDITNNDTTYLRNKLRIELLPQLAKEYNPAIVQALCNLAEIAQAETDFLESSLVKIEFEMLRFAKDKVVLFRQKIRKLHLAQQRALLRRAVAHFSLSNVSFAQLEALRGLLSDGGSGEKAELSGNLTAEVVYDELWLYQGKLHFDPLLAKELPIPGNIFVSELKMTVKAELFSKNNQTSGTNFVIFDYNKLKPPFYVRTRKNGDVIDTSGGRKKIKKLLIDAKIPRSERERLLVLTDSERVLWLVGIQRSAFARPDENTDKFLRLNVEYK